MQAAEAGVVTAQISTRRDQKSDQSDAKCEPANLTALSLIGDERHHQRPHDGEENGQTQPGELGRNDPSRDIGGWIKGALTANSSKGQVFHHCLECRNPGSGGIHSIGVDTHTDQPVRSGLVDRTAQDTEQHHQTDDAAEDD